MLKPPPGIDQILHSKTLSFLPLQTPQQRRKMRMSCLWNPVRQHGRIYMMLRFKASIPPMPQKLNLGIEWIHVFPKIGGYHPKSSIFIGLSIINHPFWSIPIFGNTHMINFDGSYSWRATTKGEWLTLKGNYYWTMIMGGRVAYSYIFFRSLCHLLPSGPLVGLNQNPSHALPTPPLPPKKTICWPGWPTWQDDGKWHHL